MTDLDRLSNALDAMSRPVNLGADPVVPQVLGPGEVPGDFALKQIADLYGKLQAQGRRITSVYGLANIPCDVQARHNAAVVSYQKAASIVFQQIAAAYPSYKIVQQAVGADGTVVGTTTGTRPLMPQVFQTQNCPMTAPMSGGQLGAFGAIPLVAWIIIAIISAGAVVAAAAIVVKKWPRGEIAAAEGQAIWVQTRLDCVERQMSIAKANGSPINQDQANATCAKIVGDKPPEASGISASTVFLLLGIGVTGGLLIYALLSKKSSGGREYVDDGELDGALDEPRETRARSRRCLCF